MTLIELFRTGSETEIVDFLNVSYGDCFVCPFNYDKTTAPKDTEINNCEECINYALHSELPDRGF